MKKSMDNRQGPIKRILSVISISGLIAGFQNYLHTWRQVLSKRGRLADLANHDEAPASLNSSIAVYLYGVALSFVLYLPILQIRDPQLPKLYFLLQFLYLQALHVFLVHLSMKAFRGHGSIKDTAAVFCTWSGIVSPVTLLLGYPIFLYSPTTDFIHQAPPSTPDLPQWILIWGTMSFFTSQVSEFKITAHSYIIS